MQTFSPVDSVCVGCPTTSSSIFNSFARVCFSRKVSNGQKFTGSKFVHKTSPQCNSIDTHLNPASRATSKWPIKICGTWLVIKQFYRFFANHSGSFSENWIIFPRFCTLFTYRLFTVTYFSVSSSRSTALHYGRHHISWIFIKSTFPPPSPRINPTHSKPRLDLETALLFSANQIQ